MEEILEELGHLISSVGFPITAAAAMYKLCTKTIKDQTEAISALKTTLEYLIRRRTDD